jgi:hypothetical protein
VYEKHVAIIQVQNHKAKIPSGLFSLDMVMFTEEDVYAVTDTVQSSIQETTSVTTEILNSDDTTQKITTTVVETTSPLNKPDSKNRITGDPNGNLLIEDLQRYNSSLATRFS